MRPAALGNKEKTATLFTGAVRARSAQWFMVVDEATALKAERAAGCLLAPEVGDEVLCTRTGIGLVYILSVLVRAREDDVARISAGNHIEFSGQTAKLDFDQAIDLVSPSSGLHTETVRVSFDNASVVGGRLTGTIQTIKTVTHALEVKAGRILQRAGRVYRRVSQFEDSQIGRIRLLVDDLFQLKSKNTNIKAEKRVKVDGKKIELG